VNGPVRITDDQQLSGGVDIDGGGGTVDGGLVTDSSGAEVDHLKWGTRLCQGSGFRNDGQEVNWFSASKAKIAAQIRELMLVVEETSTVASWLTCSNLR
jgi:hypothetical protein